MVAGISTRSGPSSSSGGEYQGMNSALETYIWGDGAAQMDDHADFRDPTNINSNILTDKSFDWGMNPETFGAIGDGVDAFSSLAQIYAGFKAMKLNKEKFRFQKDAWNKGYQNEVKDYENNLKNRWEAQSSAHAARGIDYGTMDSYVNDRRLTGRAPTPTGFGETDPAAFQRGG